MDINEHKRLTISGLKWNLANQVIVQALTLVVSVLMMRILSPKEFGLIGMVAVFSGFLTVFRDFSLGSALIQKKEVDNLDKNTIFWISLILGAFLSLLLISMSPIIGSFYNEPRLVKLASVLAIVFLFQGVNTIPNAMLMKEMLFQKLFLVNTCAITLSSTVALLLAFQHFGVWALVIQQVTFALVSSLILWSISKWRPGFSFSTLRLKQHLRFATPMVATQSLGYWTRNMDNLLIGKSFGSIALGLYSRAYSIMMLPVTQVSHVIATVMFPAFSLIQEEKARIKYIYLKVSRVIAFVTFPLMGILILVADPLVSLVFGNEWLQMIPILRVLAIVGALQSIGSLIGNIFMSQGKSKVFFYVNLFSTFVIISAFFIGASYSIQAVAFAYLIAVIIILPVQWHIAGGLISCSLMEMVFNIIPHIGISAFLITTGTLMLKRLSYVDELFLLLLTPIFYVGSWVLLTRLFNKGAYCEITGLGFILMNKTGIRDMKNIN